LEVIKTLRGSQFHPAVKDSLFMQSPLHPSKAIILDALFFHACLHQKTVGGMT